MKEQQKSARTTPTTGKKAGANTRTARASGQTFTDEERDAMKERAREMKASRGSKADVEREVLAKIAEMTGTDRTLGERLHAIIRDCAPELSPKLWYGMPAYARDEKIVCFFQCAQKFKARYATLGFSDQAHLDDGSLWPVAFALKALSPAEEATVRALVTKAAAQP